MEAAHRQPLQQAQRSSSNVAPDALVDSPLSGNLENINPNVASAVNEVKKKENKVMTKKRKRYSTAEAAAAAAQRRKKNKPNDAQTFQICKKMLQVTINYFVIYEADSYSFPNVLLCFF